MPLDLDAFCLDGPARLRMALLQEMPDHCPEPIVALEAAIQAEGWIIGEAALAAQAFAPEMLIEVVRPLIVEQIQSLQTAPESSDPAGESRDQQMQRGGVQTLQPARSEEPEQGGVEADPAPDVRAISSRRAELKRLWEKGVPAGEIAKKLGYAHANSVKATAVNHMGLAPRAPEISDEDAIAKHVKEKGVMTQPNFGDEEINALYPKLRERGHTLNKVSPTVTGPRRFILDSSSYTLTRKELLERGKAIVEREKPLKTEGAK